MGTAAFEAVLVEHLAKLGRLFGHLSGQVVFLGVDYVDTEPEAMGYLAKFDISYPNGPDLRTRISQSFRIQGVPETYFIDQDGTLTFVKKGPFTSLSEIRAVIDPLLEP